MENGAQLYFATAAFLATHFIPATPLRGITVRAIGEKAYLALYSLIRAFSANHVRFHAADGKGYAFLADQVLALDKLNPQVEARIARGFDRWKRFDANRQSKSKAQLERIRDASGLSRDVAEIVGKALA